MFLIDASPSMFEAAQSLSSIGNRNSSGSGQGSQAPAPRTYLDVAVDCAQSVLRSRIISAPNDKQGIVFFATREKRGQGGLH